MRNRISTPNDDNNDNDEPLGEEEEEAEEVSVDKMSTVLSNTVPDSQI